MILAHPLPVSFPVKKDIGGSSFVLFVSIGVLPGLGREQLANKSKGIKPAIRYHCLLDLDDMSAA